MKVPSVIKTNHKNMLQGENQSVKTYKNLIFSIKKEVLKNYQLFLIVLVPLIFVIAFNYVPMLGAQIAFKKFSIRGGIWGSPFVGFENFEKFFSSYIFERVIVNTIGISIYSLVANFFIPIILALSLNITINQHFKKTVQMVTYAPYFISTVVMVSMINQFFSPRYGIVNAIIKLFGGSEVMILGMPKLFSSLYVWTGIWQTAGWSSIIYIAALSGIDQSLHEAAIVDGANRFKRIMHIDIPGIKPTIIILLILSMGNVMNIGFEKVYLMQNPMNLEVSEIISTYVYKVGLQAKIPDYSYSTAIGLFNSLVNFTLLVTVNSVSKRVSETQLW